MPRPEEVVNVDLQLSSEGWAAAAAALAEFTQQLEGIVHTHQGEQEGRVVAALLGNTE